MFFNSDSNISISTRAYPEVAVTPTRVTEIKDGKNVSAIRHKDAMKRRSSKG